MKTVAMLMSCLGLSAALAQEASTNKPPASGTVEVETTVMAPESRAAKALSQPGSFVAPSKAEVGGAIPKAARSKNFFQMINPFAPKEYGDGTDVVARHPVTGEAQGVTLLMLSCPERPNQPKAKPPKTKKSKSPRQ